MLPQLRSALSQARRLLGVLFLLTCSAHGETFEAKVIGVADGDSIAVLLKQERIRVRLMEIDAPELKQAFGKRSQESLASLCTNKTARVTWTQKDRNGRTLGRVRCAGIDVNAEQVRRGMAWVFDRYVKDRSLYAVQDEARRARLGLWRDAAPVPPWEWRRVKGEAEYKAPK